MARVAERIAGVAVHLQKPTAAGMIGIAGTALSALSDQLDNGRAPTFAVDMFVSRGQMIQAFRDAGARIRVTTYSDGHENVMCNADGLSFWVGSDGSISTTAEPAPLLEWVRKAIDRALPTAVTVRKKQDAHGATYEAHDLELSAHDNNQALRILAATLPLIDGGRCILLDGKPGVGKTTLAQIIARDAKLGRAVLLDAQVIGEPTSTSVVWSAQPSSGDMRDALVALSPGVVIVDDVDKVNLPLSKLEALRNAARLVVLTANNGQYDEVLDGALMRAGRVDEVFTIEPTRLTREQPFDRLSDAQWGEVCQWPVAYLNEMRKRLEHRPDEIRLEDLRSRLNRKTRSGDVLK